MQSGKRLRINRTNDGNGAPTGVWLSMDSGTAGDDFVQLRFIKPAQSADVANLPAGWNAQDLGEPQQRGAAFYDSAGGTWSIAGGGADIFDTSDQFQFVSRSPSGDAALIARVGSVQASDAYAKAGVMFRAGTSADSAFAHLFIGPSTVGFEFRTAGGGAAAANAYVGAIAPRWLKLVRTGNVFRAYYSADGTTWTQLGTAQTITMPASATAGLAVTAHAAALLNSSTFTDVSLAALSAWSSWQYQNFTAAQLADANISGPAADANGDGLKNVLAYAFASSPWANLTGALPTSSVQGGYLTTTFVRRKPPTDLLYAVQVSADLATWATATTETAVTSLDATTELVTIRDNVPSGGQTKRFIRVRVTQ